jgi:hypothetical protein
MGARDPSGSLRQRLSDGGRITLEDVLHFVAMETAGETAATKQ